MTVAADLTPPFPAEHQDKPGLESEVTPRPRYEAREYREAGKLTGRRALITGADSGIGRAMAYLFARAGADVSIVFLPVEVSDAEETAAASRALGRRCALVPGDVTDAGFCEQAVQMTITELGGIDILVNNAAFQQHQGSVDALSIEQWELTFRTNIHAYFYLVRAALPHLGEGSSIINTGSVTGIQGSQHLLDYSSTKGAIHTFTKSLAQQLVTRKIRINCVAPGPVWTPLNIADKPAEKAGRHGADVPMKRPAQPEEIAPAYVCFASNADSSYISGEVLTLLGGETLGAA